LAVSVAACGGGGKNTIAVDGSSTVGPLTEAAAEGFQASDAGKDTNVTVGVSGTGGGFEKFCAGETDISDASRAIEPDEVGACKKSGITYEEIQVANDGIALVVNAGNDFADCLTLDQAKKIWDKDSKVNNWNQVDPKFPDLKLELFGPGTDSGTFDFFTDKVNGEEGRSRADYAATEDDNVTVQGVSGSEGGLGYFGLSYAEENPDKVKPVAIDAGKGCVDPSTETVQSGEYTPLSRPLLIYPSRKALGRPEVGAFVKYYVDSAEQLATGAKFVPLTDEQLSKSKSVADKL
jgi:phosphate transport system substrate-binding protein